MIAGVPCQGGATWAVLQYLLGLKQLGHEVYFVEPIDQSAVRPVDASLSQSANASYFWEVMEEFGFESTSALLLAGTRETVGVSYERLCDLVRRTDLLINIAGMLTDGALTDPVSTRVYLDLDPAFTQLWQAVEGIDMRFTGHTHFVTVGCRIGQPDCSVPTCGLNWLTTTQPIVLSYWPKATDVTVDALTTVANWRGYGSIEHDGIFYGQKAHALRQFMSLPTLTDEKFVLALSIHPEEQRDLKALAENGWQVVDPGLVAGAPGTYQQFIQGSKAEIGVAKSGYASSQCGWFSDRSLCYLASGRPVIAQQTGFSRFLPTGNGLFAYEASEDVLAGIEEIQSDYPRHSRAARAIAEEYFDSRRVLTRLLDSVQGTP